MTTPHTTPGDETAPVSDPLERRLAALTDWRDAPPTLHEEALKRVRQGDDKAAATRRPGLLARMRTRPAVAVPVVAAATLVLVAAAQFLSGARESARRAPPSVEAFASPATASPEVQDRQRFKAFTDKGVAPPPADQAVPAETAALAERSVIRKASIEIQSADVRADFSRAAMLVNDGLGEFVESSSLTGEGAAAQGTLTLRVTAERLSDVLNELRTLGEVVSEKSSGDDVTEQAVDLEARLRNEQRVETELLGLLETRKGAPLKEILDMREQVARVRERIEQMTAQHERLGRSVSLATVLVILRPVAPADPAAQEAKHEASTWEYFTQRMAVAWQGGTRSLADSAADIVRALVGGLVWWALLAGVIGACLRMTREARRRASREPSPAL